jgi:hypothetical protein
MKWVMITITPATVTLLRDAATRIEKLVGSRDKHTIELRALADQAENALNSMTAMTIPVMQPGAFIPASTSAAQPTNPYAHGCSCCAIYGPGQNYKTTL